MWVLLYWLIAVQFLMAASPVLTDGAGPMPTFYWGDLPVPDFREYIRRRDYYDLVYSLPYYLAGLVFTFIGCGVTPRILSRLRTPPLHSFRNAAAVTLTLLGVVAAASDIGTLLAIWKGPVFMLRGSHDLFELGTLCQVLLPPCVLSGLTVTGERWISTR